MPSEDRNGVSLLELDILVQSKDAQEGEEDTSCSKEVPGMRAKSSKIIFTLTERTTINSDWNKTKIINNKYFLE